MIKTIIKIILVIIFILLMLKIILPTNVVSAPEVQAQETTEVSKEASDKEGGDSDDPDGRELPY